MNRIPMKKFLFSLDERTIDYLDRCVDHLNSCPEEGGSWTRSRVVRVALHYLASRFQLLP